MDLLVALVDGEPGVGLIPYSPLQAGLLAGVLQTATEGGISDDSTQQRIEAHRDQLEAYEGQCRKVGAKPADVALAWLLRNPAVSTTIVGATTIEELQSDLGALTVQLDTEVVERLERPQIAILAERPAAGCTCRSRELALPCWGRGNPALAA